MSFLRSVPLWWQQYIRGALQAPSDLFRAALADLGDKAVASDRFFDDPLDGAVFDVPQRLSAPSMLLPSDAMLSLWDRADWQLCDPRLTYWAAMVQEAARKRGIPLYVHSAFRGKAEQSALVARGVSKTPYPRSAHNIGEAVDIVHGVYHWNLTPQEWQFIAKLGRECLRKLNAGWPKAYQLQLNWGGDDGPGDGFRWDPAHWEVVGYSARSRALLAGEPRRLTPRYVLRHLRPAPPPKA